MIGHQQIIAARQQGKKPAAIFFEIGKPRCRDPENEIAIGGHPVVYLQPGEKADLRFAIGCQTHVMGREWSQAVINLGMAVADAGATTVIVSGGDRDLMIYENGDWRTE